MTTLTFQNTTLSVINQNNQTFLTASDLGKALDYSDADRSVRRLYTANADEFTPEMTALVEMPTAGGLQKVRIFSLRGAHLIAMFARTKVAKDFRKWVLDVLDKETNQPQQLELSETKGKKQRGLLPPKNPFGYMTYEREFTARELEWLVLSWYQAYEYRELLKQLFPMLEAAQSALLTPIKNRIALSDMDFKLSADVLFRITRGTDVMRLAPLITLENYVQ